MQVGDPPAPSPRGFGKIWITAGVVFLLVLGVVVVVGLRSGAADDLRDATSTPTPTREGTYDDLLATLDAHGQALARGDEPGWLAPVDPGRPAVHDYFKRLYATLRTMQVTSWTYARGGLPPVMARSIKEPGTLSADLEFDVGYCLVTLPCPAFRRTQTVAPPGGPHPAHLRLRAKVEYRDGRWRIVERLPSRSPSYSGSNVPWGDADLVFASSSRATVGAPRAQADRLDAVLAAADRAAALTDRFARHLDTPRHRFLVFLAGDDEWRRWYGGERPGVSGYVIARGTVGMDVVVRLSAVRDPDWLLTVLRHEFGHIITRNGIGDSALAAQGADVFDEGIAEYIAYAPRPATASPRLSAVQRWARRGRLPASLDNFPRLPESAKAEEAAAFYGFGHLFVGCLATRYGEAEMFRYYDLARRRSATDDKASRQAFGKPWRVVERACLAQVRRTVGA